MEQHFLWETQYCALSPEEEFIFDSNKLTAADSSDWFAYEEDSVDLMLAHCGA